MNWRFCPHCETQLDDVTGICPACRWDPLDVPPPQAREPEVSLTERYRGTEYDSRTALAAGAVSVQESPSSDRVRNLVIAGVLCLITLFGGMLAWSTYQGTMEPPAHTGSGAQR